MVWKAEELPSRLRVASVVGRKTEKEATELISKEKERSDGTIPFFIPDNLDSYPNTLLNVYGEKEEPKRERKRERPRSRPVVRSPPELQYAQVVKHRDEHGRITSIERRVVFGSEEEIKKLEDAGCYTTISTAHVESDNLMSRQTSPRLVREALPSWQGDGGAAVPDCTGRRGPQFPEASRFSEDAAQEAAADEGEERDAEEMDAENSGHGGRNHGPQVDDGRADGLPNHQILPSRNSIYVLMPVRTLVRGLCV